MRRYRYRVPVRRCPGCSRRPAPGRPGPVQGACSCSSARGDVRFRYSVLPKSQNLSSPHPPANPNCEHRPRVWTGPTDQDPHRHRLATAREPNNPSCVYEYSRRCHTPEREFAVDFAVRAPVPVPVPAPVSAGCGSGRDRERWSLGAGGGVSDGRGGVMGEAGWERRGEGWMERRMERPWVLLGFAWSSRLSACCARCVCVGGAGLSIFFLLFIPLIVHCCCFPFSSTNKVPPLSLHTVSTFFFLSIDRGLSGSGASGSAQLLTWRAAGGGDERFWCRYRWVRGWR